MKTRIVVTGLVIVLTYFSLMSDSTKVEGKSPASFTTSVKELSNLKDQPDGYKKKVLDFSKYVSLYTPFETNEIMKLLISYGEIYSKAFPDVDTVAILFTSESEIFLMDGNIVLKDVIDIKDAKKLMYTYVGIGFRGNWRMEKIENTEIKNSKNRVTIAAVIEDASRGKLLKYTGNNVRDKNFNEYLRHVNLNRKGAEGVAPYHILNAFVDFHKTSGVDNVEIVYDKLSNEITFVGREKADKSKKMVFNIRKSGQLLPKEHKSPEGSDKKTK